MNCPSCKSPINQNSFECEWCGYDLGRLNRNNNFLDDKIKVVISFEGVFMFIDYKVKVFADDVLVGTGSIKNGFHIEFEISKKQPVLLIKYFCNSQKLKIPKFEFGKNYEIIISFDYWWKGNFNSEPVKIITT